MIVCDDHFLNDESILKTMLRVFKKRIIRILRLKSISWVVFFLSFRREARDVCMCVCLCLCAWEKRMQIKSVVFEKKNLSFVEFKDFCLLKSILDLIIRSLVNIKKKEKVYFVDRIQKFEFKFALQVTKVHFTRYYTRSNLRLFYFILIFCAVQLFKFVEFYFFLAFCFFVSSSTWSL
jgi:hypothetical protein